MSEPIKPLKIFGYWAGDWEAGIRAGETCITIDGFSVKDLDGDEARSEVKKAAYHLLEAVFGDGPDNGIHLEDECVTCGAVDEHKKGCPDQEPEPQEL